MPPHHLGLLLASALALLCHTTPTSSALTQLAVLWHQPLPLHQRPTAPLRPAAEHLALLRLRGGVSREDLEARAAEMRKKEVQEGKAAPGEEKVERKGGAGADRAGGGGAERRAAAVGETGQLKVIAASSTSVGLPNCFTRNVHTVVPRDREISFRSIHCRRPY